MTRIVCVLLLVSWFSGSALGMVLDISSDQQSVLMCTQNGYEWVIIGSEDSTNSASTSQHCEFCLLTDVDVPFYAANINSSTFFNSGRLMIPDAGIVTLARANLGRWYLSQAPPL